jgi:hypothetical protein
MLVRLGEKVGASDENIPRTDQRSFDPIEEKICLCTMTDGYVHLVGTRIRSRACEARASATLTPARAPWLPLGRLPSDRDFQWGARSSYCGMVPLSSFRILSAK